jgi:hypothetical protein
MLDFIKEHYDELCIAFTALITFCSVVVKLTPTQKDDAMLNKVITFISYFSIIKPKDNK